MSDYTVAFTATTDLPGVPFETMRSLVLAEINEHDLIIQEESPNSLIADAGDGLFGIRKGDRSETALIVAAHDQRGLFLFKWGAVERLKLVFPEAADAIRWSDGDASGGLPPNFQFVRVKSVTPVGNTFLRVTFEAEDFSAYGDDAIHFRVVLPPENVSPEWPTLAPNGSVKWPEGPAAPHRPVYTARRVDQAAKTLEMDVFLHDGGRMTAWTQDLMAGTDTRNTVGLIGPAGGGIIEDQHVLIGSDETGFPPVARLIESLPQGARATVFLEAEHGANCAYPMPQRDGITLHWCARSQGQTASQAVLDVLDQHAGAVLWFAGEREDAKRVRDAAKAAGYDPKALRVSGFWTANPTTE